MWRAILAAATTMCLFLLVAATTAHACPSGSRFSGYNGNGICVYIGQGLATAVHCEVASGTCPEGTTREHSGSDPNRRTFLSIVASTESERTARLKSVSL